MILVFNNPKKIQFKNPKFISIADCQNNKKPNPMKNIWSNKKFLKKNYTYLNNLNKKIIIELARQYKKNFNMNYSINFWKLILTPWVSYFSFLILDNYYNLKKAKMNRKIKEIYLARNEISDYIPLDFQQFAHILRNDEYRFFLFSNVEKLSKDKTFKYKFTKLRLKNSNNFYLSGDFFPYWHNSIGGSFHKKPLIKKIATLFFKSFFSIKRSKYLMLDLPARQIFKNLNYFKFYLKFSFIPLKYKGYGENTNYNLTLRNKFKLNLNNNNFEKILSNIIRHQIPCSIFENFSRNIEFVKKNYPKNIKKISSTTSFWDDDLVKIWIALSTEKNTKFYPRQHGGSYGTDLIHVNEYYEKIMGKKFLSWGWKDKNTKPMPSLEKNLIFKKKIEINQKSNNFKNIKDTLMIVAPACKYTKSIYSTPMGNEWYFHNKKILDFSTNYSKNFKSKLVVRNLPHLDDWNLSGQLKNISPNIVVESGGKSIQEQLNDYPLIIGTNPSTTMFDILISKKPCIFFWPKSLWTFRSSAKKYYELLEKKKVLFFDEKKAINHLKTIYKSDINDWWHDKDRQKAIQKFLNHFCMIRKNYLDVWKTFLIR